MSLIVAVTGGTCGFAFLLIVVFMLGLDQPSMSGQRGRIGSFIEWFNIPLVCLLDWLTNRDVIAPDSLFVGSIIYLTYWALLGAVMALCSYCLWCQIPKSKEK